MSKVLTRLRELQERVQGRQSAETGNAAEAIEELSLALEELQAADAELREKNQALAAAERRYQELFNLAPDAYVRTDLVGGIREANRAAAALFRVSQGELVGKPLSVFVAEEARRSFRRIVNRLQAPQNIRDHDLLIHPRSAMPIQCAVSVVTTQDVDERPTGLLWLIRNISERKYAQQQVAQAFEHERAARSQLGVAQQALGLSEERFRVALLNSSITVFTLDCDLRYTWVYNPVVRFGKADVVGKTDAEVNSAENPEQLMEMERSVLEGTGTRVEVTREDGPVKRYLDVTLEPLRDAAGKVIGLTGAAIDITDRKYHQEWLEKVNLELDRAVAERVQELEAANMRLRSLTEKIVNVQEDERLRVSRELHDEAGQALAALKMSIEALRDDAPMQSAELRSRMDDISTLISQTLEEIRTLAQDLRPPALDTATLDEILEGVCSEFMRRTGIPTYYQHAAAIRASPVVKVTLYRLLQEALTNIIKHSHATTVKVRLESNAKDLVLSIEDDGRGFEPETLDASPKLHRIGLVGMQERLRIVGGWLDIDSEPGQGTRLAAHIPNEEAA